MPNKSLYRTYRSTFCIFPALIPLVEILPWVLAAIGALAGGTQAALIFWHTNRKKLQRALGALAISAIVAAGFIYADHARIVPDQDVGSELVAKENLPKFTAYTRQETIQNTTVNASSGVVWTSQSAAELLGNPVVSGDMLVQGTFSNSVQARRRSDGVLLWEVHKRHPVFTAPVIADGVVYVGEGLHTADVSGLTAIHLKTGEPIWERRFASHIESYPAVDAENNRLWAGAGSLGLWALDTEDGSKLWWVKIGHIDASPIYDDGRLFAMAKLTEENDGSAFFELDPDNGDILKKIELPGNPMGQIFKMGHDQFVVSTAVGQVGLNKESDKGWVMRVDLANKDKPIVWQYELTTMAIPEGQMLADKSLVYFAVKNGEVVALDTQTGKPAWTRKCGTEFKTDTAILERNGKDPQILALTRDGRLHYLNARTGEIESQYQFESGSYPAPIVQGEWIYITTHHNIYAIENQIDGKVSP